MSRKLRKAIDTLGVKEIKAIVETDSIVDGVKQDFSTIACDRVRRLRVYKKYDKERRKQDEQWGGPEHDDQHGPEEWADFIGKQLTKLKTATESTANTDKEIRRRLVKIGALATAALESIARH